MRNAVYVFLGAVLVLATAHATQAAEHQHLPGQNVTLVNLPAGLLRDQITALPAGPRARALAKLRELQFPDSDTQAMRSDVQGDIYAVCFETPPAIASAPAAAPPVAAGPIPISALPAYHSKPGLTKVLYLDFDGEIVTGTAWNSSAGVASWNCKIFDTDNDPTTYSDGEIAAIYEIWQRVAEDYAPFAIDVTTEKPASYASNTVAHALITSSTDNNGVQTPSPSAGGVAYVGVFGGGGYATTYSPAWVYFPSLGNGNPKFVAEAVSHEVGHNLGLNHDGTSAVGYYQGHGSGEISWGPIMGVGYYTNVVQFSKGEYPDANNTQDDLAIIAAKLAYSADAVGNTNASATALTISGGTVVNQAGVIGTTSDVDVFSFTCGTGTVSLTLSPFLTAPNLDIQADLYDSGNTLITTVDNPTSVSANLSVSVAAGVYYLKVSGVGAGDLITGYSDYASLGQYTITGSVPSISNSLSFSAMTYAQVEGNSGTTTATITVTRTGSSSGAIGVSYATADNTATAGSDYTATSGTLNWANGDAADKTFTVTIAGDGTFENDETVLLSLSNPTGGGSLGSSSATLTITNDDTGLSFSTTAYTQAEGNSGTVNATITVTRLGGSIGAVGVSYATADGTATVAGSDYTASSGTLSWANGDTANKTFTVTVTGDTIIESDETVLLSLSSPTGGATLGVSSATLSITNDDAASGTLAFSSPTYSMVEGNTGQANVTITATRSGGSSGVVGVSFATADGTATAGSDYTATSGTLSWANGDTANKTFNVKVSGDTTVESDETIRLSLASPSGGASIGTSSAILTIVNNDASTAGTLAFSAATYAQAEGNSGTTSVTITAIRSGGSTGAVTVNYATADGTATVAGSDYTATNGTLSWADGDTANKTFTVTISGDVTVESDETILLSLSGESGGAILGTSSATLTITNDDSAPVGTLAFSAVTYAQAEGNSGTATVTITAARTGGSNGVVGVGYATANGTASAGSDYTATSGTLSWADGDTANKTFTVTISGDTTFEGDETVLLSLSSVTGGASLGTSNATLTITNDDAAPIGTLAFSAATYAQAEGDSGTTTVTITATRVGGSNGAVTVNYATSDGTATAGTDYTAASGTLSWANGDTAAKTFTVTIIGDTTLESDEIVLLSLSGVTGGATLGLSSATLTITNDDAAPAGTLAFSAVTYAQAEGDSGTTTVTITVTRSGGSIGAVGVNYATANGTASAGSDYTATSGTLSWANGDAASKTFTVTIIGDTVFESDETVLLSLSSATGGAILGTSGATLTITNDDAAPAGTLAFSSATYAQAEGNSGTATVTITATRSSGSNGAVTVDYDTADGTATVADSDYASASGTLSWANGDTASKTFTVTIIGDTTFESDETVALSLSGVTGGASLGSSSATLTIINDESAPNGSLALSAATYARTEGNSGTATVTITATRVGGSSGAVGVSYATANGTALAGSDYTAASGTLSWANGDTANKTFTVTIIGDISIESSETVAVSLSSATGGATLGTSNATLTITNDDGVTQHIDHQKDCGLGGGLSFISLGILLGSLLGRNRRPCKE